jgi:thiosulfate dehydrogenase
MSRIGIFPRGARAALLLATLALSACDDRAPAEVGQALFSDPDLSTSPFNVYSCATCHAAQPGAPGVIPGRHDPGFNLAGSTTRASWWGGYEIRWLDAVNVCLERFMGGRRLAAEDADARALFAHFERLDSPPTPSSALPLTIVRDVTPLRDLAGDSTRGKALYDAACGRCHGQPHTGTGRLTPRAGIVPEDTARAFPMQSRAVVVEKVRHGRFLNLSGVMPFYPVETLSDGELADILSYLGL